MLVIDKNSSQKVNGNRIGSHIITIYSLQAHPISLSPRYLFRYKLDMGFGKSPSKNPYPYKNPEEHGLSYDNVSIDSKDGTKLRGWYIKYAE